ELQKERGTVGVFVGSKGGLFSAEMLAQRKVADGPVKLLEELSANGHAEELSPQLAEALSTTMVQLRLLPAKRGEIDSLSLTAGEATGYFTKTIAKLLAVIPLLEDLSPSADISQAVTSYYSYLLGKEMAGQERAAGTSGFAAGKLDLQQLRRFQESNAE
ncbi:MAG: nitrate- and nitrite sensing domain-containing protein, partial [Rhodospirillaceae bacterium]|nr:nitrate- and nitrite sensing domain-containing protein [Rhodospirillaceae bacterium]